MPLTHVLMLNMSHELQYITCKIKGAKRWNSQTLRSLRSNLRSSVAVLITTEAEIFLFRRVLNFIFSLLKVLT